MNIETSSSSSSSHCLSFVFTMKRVHVTPDLEVVHNGAADQPCYFLRFCKKLSKMTSNLLAQHKSTGTQYIICVNQLPFMFFKSRALSTQLHRFTREELIASWSYHDPKCKKKKAEESAVLKIYGAASTDSSRTLITQEPSNLPACSCSNLSLLFIKCVTMNRRVLSEWQFNFHHLHYGSTQMLSSAPSPERASVLVTFSFITICQPSGLRLAI